MIDRNARNLLSIDFEKIPIFGIFTKILIMSKNTSITLGDYFDDFIQNILREGRYKNASEIVRAGLRLLEEEERKVVALRNAIEEGIKSGHAKDFDPDQHLKMLKTKKK